MVTKVVIEDGATVDVAAKPGESKKKEKGKEQMSTATTTTVTETEAVAQENAQLKNIIAAMRADAAQKQQQAAPAQTMTPEAIASLMASVAAAKEIAEKVESYNSRIDEIKKDLEDTKAKLTNLPAPVAASSGGGGAWDGTNWVAPVLVGTAVTAAAGLGLWYFVLRD